MIPKLIVALLALTIYSCTSYKTDNTLKNYKVLNEPKISQIYFNTVCQGDSCSYVHYLMLTSFDETKFNEYDFVYIADKYLDSVKRKLPVAAVQFCKPFKFVDIGGSENNEQLTKNAITSLWYEPTLKGSKIQEISHISIWSNGQRNDLGYLHVKLRMQRMQSYDSKK